MFKGEKFTFHGDDGYYDKNGALIQEVLSKENFSRDAKVLDYYYEDNSITIEEFIKMVDDNHIPLSTKIFISDEWGINPINNDFEYCSFDKDEVIIISS